MSTPERQNSRQSAASPPFNTQTPKRKSRGCTRVPARVRIGTRRYETRGQAGGFGLQTSTKEP